MSKEMIKRVELWKKPHPLYSTPKMTQVRVVQNYLYPKHFILTNEVVSDPEDYTTTDEEFDSSANSEASVSFEREATRDSLADDMDLDFMMPSRVREILRSEGVSKDVIDKSVRPGEKKYRMALHLTVQQQKTHKVSKDSKKLNSKSLILPKIAASDFPIKTPDHTHTTACESCHDVTVRREKRNTRTKPWTERIPCPIDDTVVNCNQEEAVIEHPMEDEFEFNLTDVEKIKWFSEQQFEKAMVGASFEPPRLVLVSSKIPKHNLLQKMLNPNVIFLVYGGPGYLYILRKIAVTPQKMKKDSYKCVREFWRNLSNFVSKIDHNEAAIHITGCGLDESFQGREVIRFIQRLVQGNMVRVYAHDDQTEKGQNIVANYFNVPWFNIWKAHLDESDDEVDFEKIEKIQMQESGSEKDMDGDYRTWSSLAGELDDELK
ncbi:hypothetical protein FSP39_023930 [Pinctada imbricata]|uniref:Uncharacterized protein n=1 Tax=Pinctada imbricata TaxID=66713 RepID=A0AA88XMW2_PINIB|nr:hypothetical protein FSP39_023930 [Pinctada imbricata]